MSSKSNNKKKKVVTQQMPTAQATLVALISPFTDFTNLQMFLQQQQLRNSFMNPLTLNKANTEHEETKAETQMLIEKVGNKQPALQRVKDPREKDKIISNMQSSSIASSTLKKAKKAVQNLGILQ
ncbi:16870_t:CDS:2 [Funneliformis geosporum]|uniref:16870_t:CDS:1 n=1 Tax=Funneliformis geosporum TaxID=1117311 RepID=A0A9W4SAF5_9GLOM|nr:16870_t:CDS:2 [Funneliformis geosporum]